MRTKNYLGRHDENRGIVLFCIVLGIVLTIILGISVATNSNKKQDKGVSNADGIATIVEKQLGNVDTFEIKDNSLVLKGMINEGISENLILKLQDVKFVLKDKSGDKYEFDADYFISTEGIEFSSILEDKNGINLESIDSGEYYVLIRIKYESTKTEEGYKYRYYTLKNGTENNNAIFNNMNIFFDTSDNVSSYLTIENK